MKKWIHASSEFDNLISVKRVIITVSYVRLADTHGSTEILPLQNPDGSYDELALDLYEEFIVNALEIFGEHDFVIIDEQESPRSKSNYFTFVKEADLNNADYKYILFVRLSDHDNRKESKARTKQFYDNKAQQLKQPELKAKQTWKLKEITVNNKRFNTYEEALDEIDRRLESL